MTRFFDIARFDFGHQARQRSTWIYAGILIGFAFLSMTRFVNNTRGTLFDAPLAIAGATILTSLFGLLVTAALAADAATRDAQTRMAPLVHTAPLSKSTYLGARFLSAFSVNALLLAAVPAGLLLASLSQRADTSARGSFPIAGYASALALLAVPNAFIAMALLFSLSTLKRSSVPSYVGALMLFLASALADGILAEAMGQWSVAKVVDPFGFVVVRELARSWTPEQKDALLVPLNAGLLWNRVLWLAISVGMLALMHRRFRFNHEMALGRRRKVEPIASTPSPRIRLALPRVPRSHGRRVRIRQVFDIAWRAFRPIVTRRGLIVVALPAVFLVLFGPNMLRHLGTPLVPTTASVVRVLTDKDNLFLSIIIPFLIALYAGELIWRERDARISDITDVTPVPEWVLMAGKLVALGMLVVVMQGVMMIGGMLLQSMLGFNDIDVALYVQTLFGLQLANQLLFAVLALAIQVVVNHKPVAHLAALLVYVWTSYAKELGIEHHLLVYGSDPGWSYSDMSGFAGSIAPFVWFKLYWTAWAILIAAVARLFWVRGKAAGGSARMQLARRRLTRATAAVVVAAIAGIAATGGFIFYNTNVLHEYRSAWELAERRAAYERRFGKGRDVPQPVLTAANLLVEIHTERRQAEIRGTFRLRNRSAVAIESIHVATGWDVETRSLQVDREVTRVDADRDFGDRVFHLRQPLQPNDEVALGFDVHFAPRGFTNRGVDPSVTANGTYFTPYEWLPAIGYQSTRELDRAADRRAHRLPERGPVPSLDDARARSDVRGMEQIAFDAVVGTTAGETAIAPGTLRRAWSSGGRSYFHYVADAPIRNDYAFYSAKYAVHEMRSANGVAIQIVHHPAHRWNVDRMARSAKAALENYGSRFGAYPHRELRIVEHPGDAVSLHAAPVNISYEEGFARLNPDADPRDIDLPFAVVAHEVAHQWWGNRLTPAFMEGGPLVTEGLAWYSAMGVVETAYGREHLHRLLATMRESYRTPRALAGPPLLRARDWFQAYRRGAFAMAVLREYAGADRIDAALRHLLEQHPPGQPPLPASRELYAELRAAIPDSLRPLAADLFEHNTIWELSAQHATAQQLSAGSWQVTLGVRARKTIVGVDGTAKVVAMNDPIEIVVLDEHRQPIHRELHRVRSGDQRIVMTVPRKPHETAIDPDGLIDPRGEGHVAAVAAIAALSGTAGRTHQWIGDPEIDERLERALHVVSELQRNAPRLNEHLERRVREWCG